MSDWLINWSIDTWIKEDVQRTETPNTFIHETIFEYETNKPVFISEEARRYRIVSKISTTIIVDTFIKTVYKFINTTQK